LDAPPNCHLRPHGAAGIGEGVETRPGEMSPPVTFSSPHAGPSRASHSRHGGFLNADLGEYVLPVNADIGSIDVEFIDEPDFQFNSAGAKGLGEVSLTGVAPAIANAVFHVVASNAISGALSVFPNRAGAPAALAGALQFGAGALNDRGR
jgi:hypothetical protein